jgi:hypothetical protein
LDLPSKLSVIGGEVMCSGINGLNLCQPEMDNAESLLVYEIFHRFFPGGVEDFAGRLFPILSRASVSSSRVMAIRPANSPCSDFLCSAQSIPDDCFHPAFKKNARYETSLPPPLLL